MLRDSPPGPATSRPFSLRAALTLAVLACGAMSFAQSPATPPAGPPPDTRQSAPAPAPDAQSAPAPAAEPAKAAEAEPAKPAEHADAPTAAEFHDADLTEDALKQQLVGKTFYLRGGYLDNSLHFNQKGELDGSSPKASYTLSLVEIDSVKVDKRRVELEGVRFGLHFLGALATEDQGANVDKVKLTSKKKPLKITLDRELVVAPKKQKTEKAEKKRDGDKKPAPQMKAAAQLPATPLPAAGTPQTQAADALPQAPASQIQTADAPVTAAMPPTAATAQPAKDHETNRHGEAITTNPAEAARMLRMALDRIFSSGIDEKMVATLPDYWKLYYKAVADKAGFKPTDPSVLRSNQVDKKPRLTAAFEPPSNEYAQNNGVAGIAMYHVIVGADGKPHEVAVGRPIGFGLDENAVDAIRKASFEPGVKDGKPVPVEVDLTVQFRIYSKRTAAAAGGSAKADTSLTTAPKLPGPYSVNLPQPAQQTQPQ